MHLQMESDQGLNSWLKKSNFKTLNLSTWISNIPGLTICKNVASVLPL